METKTISFKQAIRQNRTILMTLVVIALFLNAGSFDKMFTFGASLTDVILWVSLTWVACIALALVAGCINIVRVTRHNKMV